MRISNNLVTQESALIGVINLEPYKMIHETLCERYWNASPNGSVIVRLTRLQPTENEISYQQFLCSNGFSIYCGYKSGYGF